MRIQGAAEKCQQKSRKEPNFPILGKYEVFSRKNRTLIIKSEHIIVQGRVMAHFKGTQFAEFAPNFCIKTRICIDRVTLKRVFKKRCTVPDKHVFNQLEPSTV